MEKYAQYLIELIENAGYEAFEVGGCVRDFLMNKACADIDITTSASPQETEKILEANNVKYIETGIKHGTITAVIDGKHFEITTYRTDGDYKDSRHPESVEFVKSIDEDLSRRDFTVNAMAYNRKTGLVDLFGGKSDIENKIIRAVGDADKRFKEDALRIMRAIRFASVLSFAIEENTEKAIFDNKDLLLNVSSERIFTELSKLLLGKNVFNVLMKYRDILAVVIPQIKDSFDVEQNNRWHLYDVWEHICHSVENAPADLGIRLAMLFHDIGKPFCKTRDCDMNDHFYGHPAISAQLASSALKNLKIPNDLYDRVILLIKIHDKHITTDKKNIKKWLSKIGTERTLDLIDVKKADMLSQNTELTMPEIEGIEKTRQIVFDVLESEEAFKISDLAVNGYDLMSIGIKGEKIGKALNFLLEKVIDGELENKKESLINYLNKNI